MVTIKTYAELIKYWNSLMKDFHKAPAELQISDAVELLCLLIVRKRTNEGELKITNKLLNKTSHQDVQNFLFGVCGVTRDLKSLFDFRDDFIHCGSEIALKHYDKVTSCLDSINPALHELLDIELDLSNPIFYD